MCSAVKRRHSRQQQLMELSAVAVNAWFTHVNKTAWFRSNDTHRPSDGQFNKHCFSSAGTTGIGGLYNGITAQPRAQAVTLQNSGIQNDMARRIGVALVLLSAESGHLAR